MIQDISSKLGALFSSLPIILFAAPGISAVFVLAKYVMEKLTIAGSDHSQMSKIAPELLAGALVGANVWVMTQIGAPHMVGVLKK